MRLEPDDIDELSGKGVRYQYNDLQQHNKTLKTSNDKCALTDMFSDMSVSSAGANLIIKNPMMTEKNVKTSMYGNPPNQKRLE
jgi:hypothetical protein